MQAVRWVPRGMLAERAPSEERARGERQASISVSRGGRVGTLAVSRGGVSRQPWRSGRVCWLGSARGGWLAVAGRCPKRRSGGFFSRLCPKPRFAAGGGTAGGKANRPEGEAKRHRQRRHRQRQTGRRQAEKKAARRSEGTASGASLPPRAEPSQQTRPDRHG